jgi:hypothetical protein
MPKGTFLFVILFSIAASGQQSQATLSKQLNRIILAVRTDFKGIRGQLKRVTTTDTTFFTNVTISETSNNEVHYLAENSDCASCHSFSATVYCPTESSVANSKVQLWKSRIASALPSNTVVNEYKYEDGGSVIDGFKFTTNGVDILIYYSKPNNAETACVYLSILKSK